MNEVTKTKPSQTSEALVKEGYKKTKLGWIPENWTTYVFSEIAKRKKEKFDPKNGPSENFKCIELEHIEPETGRLLGYTDSDSQKSTKNKFEPNTILFGKLRPYLKKYWYAKFDGVCSSEIWVLENKKGVNSKYLYYFIQSNRFISATNVSTGTKMPRADWDYLRSLKFPLPPLPEQKKIAEILSTWDRAIEALEQLITKKEELKRGLMQELLTGKTRFPGFEGEWKEMRVGKLFQFLRSISVSRNDLGKNHSEDSVLNLHYGDLHVKYNSKTTLDVGNSADIPSIVNGYNLPSSIDYAKDGDVIIVDASEDYEGVGECIELKNVGEEKLTAGLHTFLLRDKLDLTVEGFRSLIFEQPLVKKQLKRIVTGSNVYGLSKTNLAKVEVYLPTKEEQKKIVEVLQGIESEIGLLKVVRDTIEMQKKGLMQQLLTGKTRIKSEQV